MSNTRLKVNNRVRWTISLICILLILLAGAVFWLRRRLL